MADDNKLHIEISAGVEDLKKGLKEAENDVAGFGDEVEKSAKKTEKVSVSADKNTKSLGKLKTSLTDVNSGIKDLTRESGGLGDKLQGLSKVGSGVSGSLAGVASGALIAVGGILAVAAAIGTALFFYGKHRAEAFDLELQYSRLNDRVKEYEKSLWGVNSVLLKGIQGSAANIASLQSLKAQVEDTTLSQKDRLEAVNAIQKQYPSYFKDISDEKILLGEVGGAYDRLTEDIIQNAKARAGLEALTANLKKQFALEKQQLDLSVEISKNAYDKKALALTDYANKIGGVEAQLSRENKLIREGSDLLEEHARVGDDLVDLQKESARIAKIISDSGGILPLGGSGGGVKSAKKEAAELVRVTKDMSAGIVNSLVDIPTDFPFPKINLEEITEQELIVQNYLDNITGMLASFGVGAAELVAGNISSAFVDLGRVIGESLAMGENVIGAMGASLLSSMGKFLGELGEMLIVYGTYAVMMGLLSMIASTPGPQSIAAGAAAIGVGIAMVAISSAIGKRQAAGPGGSGGVSTAGVSGGGSRSRSSSGSSVSSAGAGGFGSGKVVFEIAGTKLVGVLSNTLGRNKALGGSLTLG